LTLYEDYLVKKLIQRDGMRMKEEKLEEGQEENMKVKVRSKLSSRARQSDQFYLGKTRFS